MAGSHHEWWSLPQHRWNPLHILPFYSWGLKQITIMIIQVRKYISKQQTTTDLQIKRVFWVVLANGVMTPLFPHCN